MNSPQKATLSQPAQRPGHRPVQPHERIREMDMLRGFALFGILLANMAFFSSPIIYMQMAGVHWWTEPWDQLATWGIQFFAEGKFFTMFSFLFGLGFTIFMQRAAEKGRKVVSVYLRRIGILLLIGLIHGLLIWAGDILVMYAVVGFFLLFFRHSKPKKVLRWALGLLFIPLALFSLLLMGAFAGGETIQADENLNVYHALIEHSLHAYGEGTYAQLFEQRWTDFMFMVQNSIISAPQVLSMFLFGVYAGKRRIFANLSEHMSLVRKVWLWSFILGLPLALLQVISAQLIGPDITVYDITHFIGAVLGGPALCFLYITSILLLTRKETWRRVLAPLQAVGRTALSNYLFQSIVCTTLFYSYGLGWYGQTGPAGGVLITIILFAVQILLSTMWLKSFRFGPAEWLWRTLTYGKRQPLRIK